MTTRLIAGALVAVAAAACAAPAFGDAVGTVSARVTVASACIQVSPGDLDFGVLPFTPESRTPVEGARVVTATNCSAGSASLLARGTPATSTRGATWALTTDFGDICPATNRYMLRIAAGSFSEVLSSETDTAIQTSFDAGQSAPLNAVVRMPCTGSGGGGESMAFSYIFTALLP